MTDPIFFAWTRSFWAFVSTAALISDLGAPVINALAIAWTTAFGGDQLAVAAWIEGILPLATLALAMQQRAGAARPYTMNPRALS